MGNVINEDIKIFASLKKLIEYKMSIEEYLYLYLLGANEKWKLSVYVNKVHGISDEQILSLIDRGFIEFVGKKKDISINNLMTTKKFKNIIIGKDKNENVENWINDWYALWPVGIKTGGYLIKTDRKGCLRKMKSFLVSYPEYSKEQIMEATKAYLLEQSINGYAYTKLAPYFIIKNGLSILAGECEALYDEVQDNSLEQPAHGETEL